ncbi:DUF4279 domain-containing protein [Albimonas sp. CAU 1670]|uniref:DUF4279 domain-containing protein n=1 Tax=Albimonas sp. CAU 1670 TaxID=3032599 RepID=UPI0023D98845|nr:DUF4279 domain-containing protein [Albimonas sp. CAU 1670]MDF2235831.1 DUF4279 domain-containing protein [Albimonas sp. CAU 1670]
MTSPPVTDRFYAYFRVVDPSDPEEITRVLKIEPDKVWKRGDTFEVQDRLRRRRGSHWSIDSGLDDRQPLDDHLEALLWRLDLKRDALLGLLPRHRLEFVCVAQVWQAFCWAPNFDLQRRVTDLGIGFWFDIYSLGDIHEIVSDLREQFFMKDIAR